MKNTFGAQILILLAGLILAAPSFAEGNSEIIGRCLANSTTGKDRIDLARWVFASMALHPEVMNISAITVAKREEINRTAGTVFERLLTDSCRKEVKEAYKTGDQMAIKAAFESLGRLAMQELIGNPAVEGNLASLVKFVDRKKLGALVQPD